MTHDPVDQIEALNPWYVEDQFDTQLGSPSSRFIVEQRWRVFEASIIGWSKTRGGPPTAVLDAGCGDGINLQFLTRLTKKHGWSSRVVGIDYSPLRVGRARMTRGAAIVRGSLTALALGDCTFDVVLCNQVLEHVPNDHTALSELRRVLRPGGLLIVGVPNEGSWLATLRNRALQRSILRSTDHVNMYTESKVLEKFQTLDLQILRVHREGFFVPHTALHGWLQRWVVTRTVLSAITRVAPSCAAGLVFVATRPALAD